MTTDYSHVCAQFALEGTVASVKPLGEGFINDTLIVRTESATTPDYILQRKNHTIFKDVPGMMDNIWRVTTHLKKKIIAAGGDSNRETLTVVRTNEGALYYKDDKGNFWAVCTFIPDTKSYVRADNEKLAFDGGKGIGKFQAMLSDFTEPLKNILPGFHDMRFRFEQWDATLAADNAGRVADLAEEISWIADRRAEMMTYWEKVESGEIPCRVTHNDTKISNMLFDNDDNVLCVIDLDTVLSSPCLNDFGDAIRSYTNTGEEDDANLDNVSMNIEQFKAYTKGYLSEAASFLTPAEIAHLAFSAKYITFEQVLRFLMDYIDGDHYYKIKSPDHNLQRTRAQYKLLQSMELQYDAMKEIVNQEINKSK